MRPILAGGLIAILLALPACRTGSTGPAPAMAARPAAMSWRVASAYLEDIFAQIPNSSIDDFRRDTPEAERILVNAAHGDTGRQDDNAHVYGEPAPASTDLMLRRLQVRGDDVIYDFGCGRGFFLMQALLTTPARKAVGVELAASRVNIGKLALKMMQDQGLLPPGKILDLREQDMTQADMADATLVYMDSVFYSDQLLTTMARLMSRCRNLRAVVMIQKGLPANPWFELDGTERWKMSWSPKYGTDVLFYRRTGASAG